MRLALVSTVLALAAVAATATPAAASYHRCSIGDGRGLGATYVTSLRVNHVTCDKGKRVVRAFNKCRKEDGPRGRCHHRVLRFRCTETRGYGHGQFTGSVRCTRGSKGVKFTYTQFT